MKKWICGIAIFLIYFAVAVLDGWFNWEFWERYGYIFTVGYFGFVILILSIRSYRKFSKEQKTKDEYNQTIIPKNVGAHSYIDEDAGTIYLRSTDYARMSGREWIVANSAITINLNSSVNSRTIPFSQIQTLNLNATSPVASMSFDIRGSDRLQFQGMGLMGEMKKVETIIRDPIYFNAQDIQVAEAIRNRVAGATN